MKVFCVIVLTLMICSCVTATPVKLVSQRWEKQSLLSDLEKIISDIPKEGECCMIETQINFPITADKKLVKKFSLKICS